MSNNIVVTARAFWISGLESLRQLEEAGCRVIATPRPGPLNEDEVIEQLRGAIGVIASNDCYNERVFTELPELQIVSRCGVGIDRIDLGAATDHGVIISSTPGAMTEAVADYTFGLMIAVARRIVEGSDLMRSGGWGELPGPLVYGKTLGLIGCGRIGQAVAARAAGFGMRIIAFDPVMAPPQPTGLKIEYVDFESLLRESDFISVHAPATPETREMINASRLAMMKSTAYLVNTARGALVDEMALIAALEKGQIAGAAIDVYQNEPLPSDHPLRSAPRLLLTPHNAFNATESVEVMCEQSARHIVALIQGRRPEVVCNPEVWQSPALRVNLERGGFCSTGE